VDDWAGVLALKPVASTNEASCKLIIEWDFVTVFLEKELRVSALILLRYYLVNILHAA